MPRFVILRHQTPPASARPSHFDLMLEHSGTLRTWALEQLPAAHTTGFADKLADHRLAYLDYEGEISGDRGRVTRIDRGDCRWIDESPESLTVELAGQILRGTLRLTVEPVDSQRCRVFFAPG